VSTGAPPVAGLVARPRLFALLDAPARVALVCAPAGSGKTMLVSSWLADAGGSVAWVGVEREEADATRFWGTVMDALRRTEVIAPGDPLATLVPAPLGGQDEFVERLIDGLGRLPRPVTLVLDDVHELQADAALRGLERLLARAPAQLRVIVISRRDPPLALHRLRLSGDLVEIRAADLGFTVDEAGELLAGAHVEIGDADVARLQQRTEGWAAGLRLAALSLARHDAPERFVAEFSGSERTVADYLVGEVLASQPEELRRLLMRTSILTRVNGPLADLLTGRTDGTRMLHALEEANAFVVAVDVARTWFRYHHLLADLMRLELRREASEEIPELHRLAGRWHAEHGDLVEAIRHAQQGGDLALAGELLGRQWVHLVLDGEESTLATLLAGLPAALAATDAEIAAITAFDCLARARWTDADALLATAERTLDALPPARRRRAETALGTVQLFRARRLGDLDAVLDRAAALLHADDAEPAALALLNLGIAEVWTFRLAEAEAHLQQGLELARKAGRPFVEVGCLGSLGTAAHLTHRLTRGDELLREAIALAERHGWATHPIIGVSYLSLGAIHVDRGLLSEGERWMQRAEPILAEAPEPAASVGLRHTQGMVAFASGRYADALTAFRDGERLTGQLRAPHFLGVVERQWQLRALLALGEADEVRAGLADADDSALWLNLRARLLLYEGDPDGVVAAVAPVLAGDAFVYLPVFEIESLLLDAVARTQLGEADAAERSVERALAIAEPEARAFMFMTIPRVRDVLARHPVHRTAHAAHLKRVLDRLGGVQVVEPAEPLSDRELAVLRFLPTNLSAAEIGGELFLSVHTVKTHMRKLYAKLDVHTRAEAVQKGRELGLLGSFTRIVR
jgi:LuxR family maltose regulon positive regulatory protein